ncbi:hypothetical protein Pelo_8822 [Pelomyxa schiedti]|nr:hypothetical protein Pelo_8822 [Pelomyxa schiedti]
MGQGAGTNNKANHVTDKPHNQQLRWPPVARAEILPALTRPFCPCVSSDVDSLWASSSPYATCHTSLRLLNLSSPTSSSVESTKPTGTSCAAPNSSGPLGPAKIEIGTECTEGNTEEVEACSDSEEPVEVKVARWVSCGVCGLGSRPDTIVGIWSDSGGGGAYYWAIAVRNFAYRLGAKRPTAEIPPGIFSKQLRKRKAKKEGRLSCFWERVYVASLFDEALLWGVTREHLQDNAIEDFLFGDSTGHDATILCTFVVEIYMTITASLLGKNFEEHMIMWAKSFSDEETASPRGRGSFYPDLGRAKKGTMGSLQALTTKKMEPVSLVELTLKTVKKALHIPPLFSAQQFVANLVRRHDQPNALTRLSMIRDCLLSGNRRIELQLHNASIRREEQREHNKQIFTLSTAIHPRVGSRSPARSLVPSALSIIKSYLPADEKNKIVIVGFETFILDIQKAKAAPPEREGDDSSLFSVIPHCPDCRFGHSTAYYKPNERVYALAGTGGGIMTNPNVSWLDLGTGVWHTDRPMNTPRSHAACCVVNGRIYMIGGCGGNRGELKPDTWLCESLDPREGTWSYVTPPAHAVGYGSTAACIGGSFLLFGGSGGASKRFSEGVVAEYDPRGDAWLYDWSDKLPIPVQAMCGNSCFVRGTTAFLVGASYPPLSTTEERWNSRVLCYNFVSHEWSPGAQVPAGYLPASGTYGGGLFWHMLLDGDAGTTKTISLVNSSCVMYDCETDSWLSRKLIAPKTLYGCSMVAV